MSLAGAGLRPRRARRVGGTDRDFGLDGGNAQPFTVAVPSTALLDRFNVGALQNLTARTGWGTGFNTTGDVTWTTNAGPTRAESAVASSSNVWATPMYQDHEASLVFTGTPDTVSLLVRGNSASAAQWTTGYEMQMGFGGGIAVWKCNNGTQILLNPAGTFTAPAAGDRYTFQALGSTLSAWRKPSGGAWTLLSWVVDSSFPSGSFIGIASRSGSSSVITDFGGGPLPVPPVMRVKSLTWAGR